MQAKVKLDLRVGLLEVEGSEDFVRHLLEKFSPSLRRYSDQENQPDRAENLSTKTAAVAVKTRAKTKVPAASKQSKTTGKAKRIEVERFDIYAANGVQSLEDFFAAKKPKSTGDVVAVVAYYLTQMKGEPAFTEGNVDYAYRTLQLKKRPAHLRQIIINNKNEKDLFEATDVAGQWTLTRAGEIYVEEKLPAKED